MDGFERALGIVAERRGVAVAALHALIEEAGGPASSGTSAESSTILKKLTDTTQYTGAHRHRFDSEGRGRGLAGRDSVPKGHGHAPVGAHAAWPDRSPADVRGVKLGRGLGPPG